MESNELAETIESIRVKEPRKARFSNITIGIDGADVAQYGEQGCVIESLKQHNMSAMDVNNNALILKAVNQITGVHLYRIIWRIDGKPFKKKFIKEKIENLGYRSIGFNEFIKAGIVVH